MWPWEKFVAWRYKKAGLRFGEACSYIHIAGKCLNFDWYEKVWKFWRRRYENLGYEPVGKDTFGLVGGGWRSIEELESKMWRPKAT